MSPGCAKCRWPGGAWALLAHPASVTRDLRHSLDALAASGDVQLAAALGPQHGLRGDKQDNMVESADYVDPLHRIPVFSLYGNVRRPTAAMMDSFDVLLVDLQDLGCRIYTFITTLRYVLEEAARRHQAVWVLARPNPVGRPVEGLTLRPGWESFVGAGALPMRHGLTMGELARWFVTTLRLDLEYHVVPMQGWQPDEAPGFGWPLYERSWVNPSPDAPNLGMARCYAGTVMLEGTTLSEGRGTTRPLELLRAPGSRRRGAAGADAGTGARVAGVVAELRPCWFEPTFHKHAGELCAGFQVHVEDAAYYDHEAFRPRRLFRARLQGATAAAGRLSAVAGLPLRVRARAPRHRRDQQGGSCCGAGWMTRQRRPPTWTRWRVPDEAAWRIGERQAGAALLKGGGPSAAFELATDWHADLSWRRAILRTVGTCRLQASGASDCETVDAGFTRNSNNSNKDPGTGINPDLDRSRTQGAIQRALRGLDDPSGRF